MVGLYGCQSYFLNYEAMSFIRFLILLGILCGNFCGITLAEVERNENVSIDLREESRGYPTEVRNFQVRRDIYSGREVVRGRIRVN